MALAPLDALGGIITFDARQSRRFNALAVQAPRRGVLVLPRFPPDIPA
jgi:hypothetical protein